LKAYLIIFFVINSFLCLSQKNVEKNPYLIFDTINQYIPRINKCELLKVDDEKFLETIYNNYKNEENTSQNKFEFVQRLSDNQKSFYYWYTFHKMINNNQLEQFLTSDQAFFLPIIRNYIKDFYSKDFNKYFKKLERFYSKNQKLINQIKYDKDYTLKQYLKFKQKCIDFETVYGVYSVDHFIIIGEEVEEEINFLKTINHLLSDNYFKTIKNNLNQFCIDLDNNQINLNYKGKCLTYYSDNKVSSLFYVSENDSNHLFKSYYTNGNMYYSFEYMLDTSNILEKQTPSNDSLIVETYYDENEKLTDKIIYDKNVNLDFTKYLTMTSFETHNEYYDNNAIIGKYIWNYNDTINEQKLINRKENYIVHKSRKKNKINSTSSKRTIFYKENFNPSNLTIELTCNYQNFNQNIYEFNPILNEQKSISKLKPLIIKNIKNDFERIDFIDSVYHKFDLRIKINSYGKIKRFQYFENEEELPFEEIENKKLVKKLTNYLILNPLLLKTDSEDLIFDLNFKVYYKQ
jgi:hypothetical protein